MAKIASIPGRGGEAWAGGGHTRTITITIPVYLKGAYHYLYFAGEKTEGVPGTGADTASPGNGMDLGGQRAGE